MVIIAIDAADVARTADNSDGVDVTCCRPVIDASLLAAVVSLLTDVVSATCPFDWKLSSDITTHIRSDKIPFNQKYFQLFWPCP